jgi:P4 family phage/plasmid primase-like protien
MTAELLNENAAPVKEDGVENVVDVSTSGDLSKLRVSLFADAYKTTPVGGVTLHHILADIRGEGTNGRLLKEKTLEVREKLAKAGGNKKDKAVAAAKEQLQCVTASGRFPKRAKDHLTTHTGIIQADFDHVPDIAKLKAWLEKDPHRVLTFESSTGTGVKALFRVQPPDTDDASVLLAWHEKNAFPALTTYCQRTFGERIDQSCKDVSRLCFLAHDPDATANWNAVPLDVDGWLNGAEEVIPKSEKLSAPAVIQKPDKPVPVIRTTADVQRANALKKSENKQRFRNWALDRGFRGDLRTLDLRKLLKAAKLVDDTVADDDDKVFVPCPWSDRHTTGGNGTDTVCLHDPDAKGFAWTFHCSHDHCRDRDVTSLLDWLEQGTPGCVDDACAKTYETTADDPSHNDAGRADRFVGRHGRDLRFVPEREVWLTWEKDRWRLDGDGAVERLAVGMSKAMLVAAGTIPGTDDAAARVRAAAVKEALACGDRRNIADFIHLARVNPAVLLSVDKLDADPFVVGAGNCVIDLRTGAARPYTREDFITRTLACDMDPAATCPRWEQFMDEVFPDPDVRHFVHKAVGYSLTGDMAEHVFFFPYGVGRNGKSVFVRTLERSVFGGLSVRAGRGITAAPPNGKYPEGEVAELAGARMILTSETEQGQKLNENVLKDLTGGDTMRGRHLYESGFGFEPVGKLWIVGNHKPTIRGTDDGIWRRVRLIPFTQKFEGDAADRQLPEKLAAEASGILNWCVRGCLLWQKEGLEMPTVIRAAVDEYKRDEDRLADFLEDCVSESCGGTLDHADLFKAYQRHCEDNGNRHPLTSRSLAKELQEREWRRTRSKSSKCVWLGYALTGADPF